jgi:hypothetical protein
MTVTLMREKKQLDICHIWCNLKLEVYDLKFVEGFVPISTICERSNS